MLKIRLWHSYLGIFTAPSILFFALTGALQLFDLHEAHGNYQPADLVAKLGMLHKKQVFAEPRRRPRPPTSEPAPASAEAAPPARQQDTSSVATLVLKFFFLVVSLALAATAGLGMWIGLRSSRSKRLSWFLLAAGIALPVGLLLV